MRSILTALLAVCFSLALVGGEKRDKEFVEFIKARAEKGDASAQFKIGFMYARGEGVLEDDKEAVKWFRKAAEQGNTGAQFSLGVMYAEGEGVLEDSVTAYAWLNIAAANGDKMAKSNKTFCPRTHTCPAGFSPLLPPPRRRGQRD